MKVCKTKYGKKKPTMTVGELKAELNKYADDMPIFAEWEGVHALVEASNFEIVNEHTDESGAPIAALIIDVNYY